MKPNVSFRCPVCHKHHLEESVARLCCCPQALTVSTCSNCNRVWSKFTNAEKCCNDHVSLSSKDIKLKKFYSDRGMPVPLADDKKVKKPREKKQSLSSQLGDL